ncbi:hypothetical protein H4R33_001177 [Dimargaris cristalligena]|nr:hypothetical protein H4R33_001177 [Dimargaris cristalligena]
MAQTPLRRSSRLATKATNVDLLQAEEDPAPSATAAASPPLLEVNKRKAKTTPTPMSPTKKTTLSKDLVTPTKGKPSKVSPKKNRPKSKPAAAAASAADPAVEKRQKKYVSAPPLKMKERIDRAMAQRIYMIDRKQLSDLEHQFVIMGSTGKVYEVVIKHVPSCNCVDFIRGNHCKHILFVILKVLRVPRESPLCFQRAWLTEELVEICGNMVPDPAAVANENIRNTYWEVVDPQNTVEAFFGRPTTTATATATGEPVNKEDKTTAASEDAVSSYGIKRRPLAVMLAETDREHLQSSHNDASDLDRCPVCYDDMTVEQWTAHELVWCQKSCGNNIHGSCFAHWEEHYRGRRVVNCVYCRQEWAHNGVNSTFKAEKKNGQQTTGHFIEDGRLNLSNFR